MTFDLWIITFLTCSNIGLLFMCWVQDSRIDALETYIESQTWRNL